MADNFNFAEGLNKSPEEGAQEYDKGMTDSPMSSLMASLRTEDPNANIGQYAAQQRNQEQNAVMQQRMGLNPTQTGISPNEFLAPDFAPQDALTAIGGGVGGFFGGAGGAVAGAGLGTFAARELGSDSKFNRSMYAGTGNLIEGTGDTYEFLSAVLTPWDPDVNQNTTIGDFLQRSGQKIAANNNVYIADEFKSVGWNQLADPAFWATDVAKVLPYSMSFFLPAGIAAKSARILANTNKVYKGARVLGVGEKLYKPVIKQATKKQAKRRGLQVGDDFVKAELGKTANIITSSIAGGIGGNFAEGAFVAGETMQEALRDGLSPQEAQAAASQVWKDNTQWIAADILQFGLVFGGLGRITNIASKLPKRMSFAKKISPFVQAGTVGATEAMVEQRQEVFQEWIKRRAISEQKGEDFMTYTEFYESPEMLQTRVTSAALGFAMGSRGGYVDAIAEREYQLQESERRLGDLMDAAKFGQAQNMRKDVIAYTVIDSNGNAQLAKDRVDRMVAEKQMKPEVAETIKEAIEEYEGIYESSHKGNRLSQAGKRQIFLSRVEIAERNAAKERSNQERADEIQQANETIQNPQKLETAISEINSNYDTEIQNYDNEIQDYNELIENLATVKLGKLKKDGSAVKRSSKGLTPQQRTDFTTEGRQEVIDSPGIISKATDVVKKGAKAVKEGFTQAVSSVKEKGVKDSVSDALGFAKEKSVEVVKSEGAQKLKTFFKKQYDQGKNYVKKYLSENAPKTSDAIEREVDAVKKELKGKSLTKEEIKAKAKEIVDKIKKTDLKGASGEVLDNITTFIEGKLDGTITEKFVEVAKSATEKVKSVVGKVKESIDKKTEEFNERREDLQEQPSIDKKKSSAVTVETVLNEIINSTDTDVQPNQKSLAKKLLERANSPIFQKLIKDLRLKVPGSTYVFPVGRVSINPNQVSKLAKDTNKSYKSTLYEVVLHEQIHRLTQPIINADKFFKGKGLTDQDKRFLLETKELYNQYLQSDQIQNFPRVDSYEEFLAYGITNSEFMRALSQIPVKKTTMLKSLIDSIIKVLGYKGSLATSLRSSFNVYSQSNFVTSETILTQAEENLKTAKKETSKKSAKEEVSKVEVIEGTSSERSDKLKKFLDQAKKASGSQRKDTDSKKQPKQFLTRVDEKSSLIKTYLRLSLQDKFPNVRIEFVNTQLIEGFGAPAAAVFFGSTILVNPNSAMQTDLIHELSHPYYQSIAGTPLQKRLNTLLIKRKILTPNGNLESLLDNIQYNYPLLTRYKMNGKFVTGVDVIDSLVNKSRKDVDSSMMSLIDTITDSSSNGDTIAYKNAMQSLFTQLVNDGAITRLKDQSQFGLLEEAFAFTNEDFNKKGGITNVIDNKKDAQSYDSILKRLYKRVSGLAKKEDAEKALQEAIPEISSMNYDQIMEFVQANFSIINEAKNLKENSYSKGTSFKKASFDRISKIGLFNIVQQRVKSKGLKGEDAVQAITQEIYKQNLKSYNTNTKKVPAGILQIDHDSLVRQIRSAVDRASFKEYERIVNNLVNSVTNRLDQGQRSDDSIELSLDLEQELLLEENDKGNVFDKDEVMYGDTTSKLLQAYEIEESKKNDKNPVNGKDLRAELHAIGQQTKKQNNFTFVTNVTDSTNPQVVRFVKYLKSKLNKDTLVDALLVEMSIDFANKKIETMKEAGFRRGPEGINTWVPGISFSKDESRWQASLTKHANKNWFGKKSLKSNQEKGALVRNFNNGENIIESLAEIYGDSPYWQFIDTRLFSGGRLFNYKNKRYSSVEALIKDNITDFTGEGRRGGTLQIKDGFENLLGDLIVQSRAKNYITQVNDVSENPTLIINRESSLHNKNENYADLASKDLGAYVELMQGLGFANQEQFTNIYAAMLADGRGEHNISLFSGVFATTGTNLKLDSRRNRKYVKMDAQELMLADLNDFLYAINETKGKKDKAYYDQPIAVFGSAKRRYYIKTPISKTLQERQDLLEMALNAGYNDSKYIDGSKVNPFTIEKKDGAFILKGLNESVKKFKTEIIKDSKQIENNDFIGKDGKKLSDANIKNYLFNYSIHKFMAQEMFIGKHEQSGNEIDYIKRAEGAIKRGTPGNRNVPIEFVAFEDIFTEGDNDTNAQAYVLAGDGQLIREQFGSMRKLGNQFKHVYDYVETDNRNPKMFGKRTFAKFKIDEITPADEKASPQLKKIADILRARKDAIGKQRMIQGPEMTGNLHEFLPIATFESALKVYAPGTNYMYNLENNTVEDIVAKQDEIYNSSGEAEVNLFDRWSGISGEGFMSQTEIDKERHEFHMPSQLFGHQHSNISPNEKELVTEMHKLAAKAMVGYESKKQNNVIYSKESTPEQRQKDTDVLTKLIGEEFFGNLNTSLAKYAPGLHPALNNMVQQLAASRLVKFGTKAMFAGTIAYQTSPIGRNLKAYTKVSDLVDTTENEQYKNALNRLIDNNQDYVVSEAVIPATAKKDGVKIGDLIIGTRIPAHGKQSTVVYVVKDFMPEGKDGARSSIAIPSRVSTVIGSDLDGDAIFLNYKHKGTTGQRVSTPLGGEAIAVTNRLEEYQEDVNRLLDLNLQFLGDIEVDGTRYKELITPIDISETSEQAIQEVENFYGKKLTMDNQLLPTGDKQYFNDNVPAQNMIGTIASLQRVLNVMSGYDVGFTFGINIQGYDEVSSLSDTINKDKPAGNAFAVAELLNIVLDNAKYQYANKLGLTPNTVNQFVLLSRVGIELKDVAVIMNHPIVKIYNKHRGDQSITTTTDSNMAIARTIQEYYKGTGKKAADNIVKGFRTSGDVTLDISKLKGKNKGSEMALLDLLYKTEKLTDEIFSIGKAVSVHKSIPKNGHDAQRLIDSINNLKKNSFISPNTIDRFRGDPLVQHSLALLQKQVDRQSSTSFMYTPEAREVISYIEDVKKIKLNFERYEHRQLIEDYYLQKVSEAIPTLSLNNKTIKEVYTEIESYYNRPGNNFIKKYLLLSNVEGDKFFENQIEINPNEINKFSVEETIQQARNEFTSLPNEVKDALLQYDFMKNGLGFKRKTLTPLFSKDYVNNKFNILDEVLQKEINRSGISVNDKDVADKANELILKHNNLFKSEEQVKPTINELRKLQGKQTFEPNNSASLKLDKRDFYTDHLQASTKTLSYEEYLRYLGYDSAKVKGSNYTQQFKDRYEAYRNSLVNVSKAEERLESKGLNSMSIEALVKEARQLESNEDELASPRLLHKINLVIGKKAMAKQLQDISNKSGQKIDSSKEDIDVIRKWFGANNMTSKRPEVQYVLNQIQREYRTYVKTVQGLVNEIREVEVALNKSKGSLLKGLNPRARQNELYGKMFEQNKDGIKLLDKQRFLNQSPTKEEIAFYNKYQEITGRFRKVLGKNGMGELYIPHVQMSNLEALSARGLLGLYANHLGSTSNIDNVRITGTNENGKAVMQSFGYFKNLYLNNNELVMPSGRKINELRKLRNKALKQLELGKHEDGDPIIATDLEMDTLMEGGLFSRFNASRTVRAKELTSFDLANNLKQYVRSVTFVHGYQDFEGMGNVSALVDAVIAYNQNLGNENTVEYLTKNWRQGFLRNQKQTTILGERGDKAVKFIVRWTALVHLGFNAAVGAGNILAGKYQELRERGGSQFILGEKRFWTDFKKSKDILKRHRVVEMSFTDVVGEKDAFSKIEGLAFLPMELSERWIQGASFLGQLTKEEFESGNVSEDRVMEINNRISTLHGEGYTQLDQRLLSMYSLGIAVQQYKRWFITLAYNRLKQEDINRFGEQEIGTYRAAYDFVKGMFEGKRPLSEFMKEFNALPEFKQRAIKVYLNGVGMTATLLLLGTALDDDEDEFLSKRIDKLSGDALIFTDTKRFVNYTIPPASLSTAKNTMQFVKEVATRERYKRDSKFGDAGDLKARGTARKILPFQTITQSLLEK